MKRKNIKLKIDKSKTDIALLNFIRQMHKPAAVLYIDQLDELVYVLAPM